MNVSACLEHRLDSARLAMVEVNRLLDLPVIPRQRLQLEDAEATGAEAVGVGSQADGHGGGTGAYGAVPEPGASGDAQGAAG